MDMRPHLTILLLVRAFSTPWSKKLSELLVGALCRRVGAGGYEQNLTVSAMVAGRRTPSARELYSYWFCQLAQAQRGSIVFDFEDFILRYASVADALGISAVCGLRPCRHTFFQLPARPADLRSPSILRRV